MSAGDDPLVVRRVDRSDHDALCGLFERCDCRCYCRYWHFRDDKNAWLARCSERPGENARELGAELAEPAAAPHGVVALIEGRAVGWMKVGPAERLAKLYEQRLYRGLPCFEGNRSGVFAVGCLLVDAECRRRGVARRLLQAGIDSARAAGAHALEAFPRRGRELGDHELWTGPFELFAEAGFRVIHDFLPYPVLTLDLAG